MGFDVIYFPPIHPIGRTNRKGQNNSVTSHPGEPGVPYAIGSEEGGHKAIDPSLGTMEDFVWLKSEVRKRGMEIALDFAINCSPDHPYVRNTRNGFTNGPDGTIKFAENPPKKYEDIYPLNFRCENWRELWAEMKSIILFLGRTRRAHFSGGQSAHQTGAVWEYLIEGVREKYPDVIFLSEAFTRPKMMKVLAKAGFNQSYTYFTWRNTKQELIDYFTELTQTEMREYFRGNLWPNTPDISAVCASGRGSSRVHDSVASGCDALERFTASTADSSCARTRPLPGREEYLDSEKYQIEGA